MNNFFNRFCLLLPLLLLAACASAPIKNILPPPQALPIVAHTSDRPLVALVLGSGGSRGFAHVGVIKVLEENHIPVDMVVGTSVGSFVGALYAGGFNAAQLEKLALNLEQGQLNDFELSFEGYIRGERLQDFINTELHDRTIEQLDKPFAAVATELSGGKSAAFNRGNTGMAVRASSSIPGVFLPVEIDGTEYVDGGLKDPVPVKIAQQMGADIVIAVDVSSLPMNGQKLSNALQIWIQGARIMQQTIAENEIRAAQVVIRPQIGATPKINPASKQVLLKSGEDAANAALPEIHFWLKKTADEKLLKHSVQ
ncbi:MAG: patatin-like phospholipase family protein [Sideroxydans sp.]|nr:patatin-like phospholipase family protein [Sideroxydans sp.]